MPQTKEGALKAKQTIKEKYGDDFHKRIGSKGGSVKNSRKGFGSNRELARTAGRKAGKLSKTGFKFIKIEDGFAHYIAKDTGMVVKYKHEGDN